MTTRRATLDDLPALAPLFDGYRVFYKQAADPDGAAAFLRDRFEQEEAVVFLAEARGKAVGFTLLYPSFSSVRMRPIWVLNDLFVAPEARGLGVGRTLLDAAQAFAQTTDAVSVVLGTGHANTNAQRLYEATGFTREPVYLYERPVQSPSSNA